MKPEEAVTILKSLVEGRDPSSGEDLPADTVCQRAKVMRALLVGCAAIENSLARQKRRAQLPERVGSTWTTEEDDKLRSGFEAGRTIEVLASSHQRTPNSIRARLERLKLIPIDQSAAFLRFPVAESTGDKPRRRRRRDSKLEEDRDSDSGNPGGQGD